MDDFKRRCLLEWFIGATPEEIAALGPETLAVFVEMIYVDRDLAHWRDSPRSEEGAR